jgi:hypothetical protein
MVVKYYGHNSLKEFICGKPIRFRYNLWVLRGTATLLQLQLYCGKDPTNSEMADLLLGSKVILNMLDCF